MESQHSFGDSLRRAAHLGGALLEATARRPAAPLKLNLALELTTDEAIAIVRENPNVTWLDLTGGEIFLRPDIDDIFDAVVSGCRRLAILHFPTNGFLTDRIVSSVERIAGRGPRKIIPDPAKVRLELKQYRALKGRPRSSAQMLEAAYLRYLDSNLTTGQTPMPCHALRASCFIDPWGVVYPCISYSRPIGRLRETGMCLEPIWNAFETKQLQREIWQGDCPQCWTACEAYQSILGNALAGRWRSPRAIAVVHSTAPPSELAP